VCARNQVYRPKVTIETVKDEKIRRQMLIDKRGIKCENCGLTEWRGQSIPIEMHHIDGDTDNNSESNLQLLCPNCHALTGTHKRRNKNGKRQQERRKRYADGKTW
jgi:predicted HNH restriction endonuclease